MTKPLPYDPDFDSPKTLKYVGGQFTSKTVFLLGMGVAMLTLCTIGFFVLLTILL